METTMVLERTLPIGQTEGLDEAGNETTKASLERELEEIERTFSDRWEY